MRLVFLGPPGAGKGTLAVRVAESFFLVHIATGDLLRKHVSDGTPIGKQAKALLDKGALVPDDLVISMVKARFEEPDAERGFILDGFPRTIGQARALDEVLSESHKPLNRVIYVDTSEELLVRRLEGRRVCTKCGMSFHTVNIPPKVEGVCDRCGTALIQRKDDSPDTVRNRLAVYQRETAPLVDYYKKQNILRTISGDEPLAEQITALSKFLEESVA